MCAAGWINMNTNHWRYWAERSGFIHFHLDNKNKKRMQKTKWLHEPQTSPDVIHYKLMDVRTTCVPTSCSRIHPPLGWQNESEVKSVSDRRLLQLFLTLFVICHLSRMFFYSPLQRSAGLISLRLHLHAHLSPLWTISRPAGFAVIRVASGSCSDWICTHEQTSNKTRGATGSTLICGLTGTPAETNNWELSIESWHIFQYGDVGTGNKKNLIQLFSKSSENIQTFS